MSANGFLSFFQKPDALPDEQKLALTTPASILSQFLSQSGQIGQLNGMAQTLNSDENQGLQKQLSTVDPSLMGNVSKLGTNTSALLSGQIPQDVMDQITRSSAYQSLAGGFGPASGMGHSLTARDLGLTSLNLQNQGASNLNQENSLDQALNPGRSTAASMLLSPGSIQQADYTADQYNNQIGNQNEQIDYANSQQVSPFSRVVGNTLGSLASTPFNFIQSGDSVVGEAPQLFASMFAGGAAMGSPNGTGGTTGGTSGGGGGGGLMSGLCCFIFLEAMNGELPWYVRKARDTRGFSATVRGYRWMSRWLVPAMRTWPAALAAVNGLMVKPMLAVGEDYYTARKSALAKCLKPVVAIWFTVWTILGLTVGLNERGRDATA